MTEKYLQLIWQETKMTFRSIWRYKVNMISDLLILVGAFILSYFFKNNSALMNAYQVNQDQSNYLFFIGYVFWQFGSLSLGYSTSMIAGNSKNGLLELQAQGFLSMSALYFLKLLISIVSDFLILITITAFMFFSIDFSAREFMYIIYAILWSFPSIVGMYGIGLILSAISLREKSVGQFIILVQTLLLFITNVFSPVSNSFMYLVPYTGGIEILRSLYLGNGFNVLLVIAYLAINLIWIMIGTVVFNKAVLRERKYGSFDTY